MKVHSTDFAQVEDWLSWGVFKQVFYFLQLFRSYSNQNKVFVAVHVESYLGLINEGCKSDDF